MYFNKTNAMRISVNSYQQLQKNIVQHFVVILLHSSATTLHPSVCDRMRVPQPGTTCRVNLNTAPPPRKVKPFWCKYQEHHTGHQNGTHRVTELPKSPCVARRSIDTPEDQFLLSTAPIHLATFLSRSWPGSNERYLIL